MGEAISPAVKRAARSRAVPGVAARLPQTPEQSTLAAPTDLIAAAAQFARALIRRTRLALRSRRRKVAVGVTEIERHALRAHLRAMLTEANGGIAAAGNEGASGSARHDERSLTVTAARGRDFWRGRDRLTAVRAEYRGHALNQTLLDQAAVGIILTERRIIRHVNRRILGDFRARHADELIGRATTEFFADPHEKNRITTEVAAAFAAGGEARLEVRLRRLDGSLVWCEITGRRLEGAGLEEVWVVQDATDRRAARERLEHLACHDALTGLPNRRALARRLPEAIARARRGSHVLAVGLIDLDDFKSMNDRFGHAGGDQFLQAMARRLQSRLRDGDLLVRLGGDEFLIVIDTLASERVVEQIAAIMNRLHESLEAPIEIAPGRVAEVRMSAGVAIFPGDATGEGTLLRCADVALHRVKAAKVDRSFWWHLADAIAWQSAVQSGPAEEM